jgi:hypothetical protein
MFPAAVPEPVYVYCPNCHRQLPDKSLRTLCEHCLNKQYLATMLERECEAFNADHKLELARDRGKRKHIALSGNRELSYCGIRITERSILRSHVSTDEIPENLCDVCRSVLGKLAATAMLRSGPKKGPT